MVRAELTKATTTRAVVGLIGGAVAVAALSAFSTTASAEPAALRQPLHDQEVFLLASINIGLFGVIMGIRSFTDEFRHGTIAWTILASERRWRVVAAKATVFAAAAASMALIAQAVIVAVATPIAAGKDAALEVGRVDVVPILGLAAGAGLWAVIGVGVGAVVRHQVAAVVGALIWVLVIENLAAGFLGEAGRYLPGQAAHGLAHASAAGDLLQGWAALAVLVLYAAVAASVAATTLSRRELALSA